jgi:hypothetical protein
MVILTIVAVLVAMAATAGPVLAQTDDKAAKRAAKQANKQAQGMQQKSAPANDGMQKSVPASGGAQKALPASGGTPVGTIALLGAGVLLVGGGLVAVRVARR